MDDPTVTLSPNHASRDDDGLVMDQDQAIGLQQSSQEDHINPDEHTKMSAVLPKRRLCVRDLPFHQSSNKLRIRNSKRARMGRLLSEDWFHVFLRLTTIESITYLIVCWTVFILIFAGFYVAADTVQPDVDCGLTKNR
jgi:hypothetical protein